jgi:hypothetical protein
MERGISPFGQREEVTATLADFKHSGHQLDPYRLERQTGDASLLDSGDAQAGAAASLTLKATAPESFAGTPIVRLVTGPGSVQERVVASMAGAVATVSPNWNAQYLDLPGTSGNYASTPDSAAVSVTGDIDIRVKVALDDWTPVAVNALVAKWTSPNNSYLLRVAVGGALAFFISLDGTVNVGAGSTASPTVSDGEPLWLRVTRVQSSGVVTFYTSADGLSWAQLGDTAIISAGSAIFDGTAKLEVGTQAGGTANPLAGQAYYAELRNGIDGAVVAKFDPINDALLGDTSFTSDTGEVWTINQSGSPAAELDGPPDATTGYEVRDAFDPYERGTFWGKFLARNPFYANYRARVRRGFMGDALEDMNVRSYIVDRITGPKNGRVSLSMKDLFSLIEARKAVAPVASQGELFAGISISDTTATLSPAGIGDEEYPASGHVAIQSEAIFFTRSADVLTFLDGSPPASTRGSLNTEAEAHDAEDLVQLVLSFESELVQDIIYTLLTEYAEIPAANIDKDEWDILAAAAGMDDLYTARIVEPTPVKDLIGELCEQAGCTVWHDPATDMIRFQPLRPQGGVKTVTDREWIVDGSLDLKRQDNKRVSRTAVYFAQDNPTLRLDDRKNYRQRVITPDLAAESPTQYGVPAIKEIFSRWIPQFSSGLAGDVGARINALFRDPPHEASFRLFRDRDGQLQLAEPFNLLTFEGQDDTGAQTPILMSPVEIAREENEIAVKAQGVKFFTDPDEVAGVREITLNSTDMRNLNLRTIHDSIFSAPTGDEVITFILPSGFTVGSTSTGQPAIRTGSWPTMATAPRLTIDGEVDGAGGVAGAGGSLGGNGAAGGKGGTAMLAEVEFEIDNLNGIMRGGAGGGGGGGSGGPISGTTGGGGGGGGGAGVNPGNGGAGGDGNAPLFKHGSAGSAGTTTTGGAGGAGGSGGGVAPGGSGGTGGALGSNGSAGANGGGISPGSGGAGGSVGDYISGNSLVTWINDGTRIGGVA